MFYKICKIICWILGHIAYRFEVTGKENIPEEGAFLLCSNHIHAFDPIVVSMFTKRVPRFMAKKELFTKGFGNWFFNSYGAYPIDRSAAVDMQAYRTTMDILKNGQGVVLFSQGTRMEGFDNAKAGVAMFALKSGAPIIPVGVNASYKFFSKIKINYGEAISMEEFAGQKVKTELVEKVMAIVVERVTALASSPAIK
ncbi:MAG: 1-acyl-sn-glycerol-3-phosphate acyltransferase [Clostridiales bacterium]|jgi:1-acyl-sn-glycerol-3-phosphate acyltransferase|nr:1-acyl-sn-glycerol-3-phosphate acyltransferase [Clostridiales bacterium]